MNKAQTIKFIEELSNAPGPSGFEDDVLSVIRKYGEGLGDWKEDAMRNLFLYGSEQGGSLIHGGSGDVLNGSGRSKPILMLDAHSDEVGLMVRTIRPNGTLDFVPIGGWVPSNLAAQKVLVRNKKGKWLPGVIASKPPHFLSEAEKNKAPELSGMVIDVGASSEREIREDYQISIAAPVIPNVAFEYLEERDIMIGKAFDCRLGCAAIIETLKALGGLGDSGSPGSSTAAELKVMPVAAFAAQEEMGLRGATVTSRTIMPDLAICFEGSPADDTVVDAASIQTAIKKGPMLRHFDLRMITNPRFQAFALDIANELKIPHQEGVRTGGSTNAGIIHINGKAVPCIVIGIPSRYIHTHYSMASFSDFENSVKLACEIIRRLDGEIIAGF